MDIWSLPLRDRG